MAACERPATDLPWGWWLRAKGGWLEDGEGGRWTSVREAFWCGHLGFPDFRCSDEQQEQLLRVLAAIDARWLGGEGPRPDALGRRRDLDDLRAAAIDAALGRLAASRMDQRGAELPPTDLQLTLSPDAAPDWAAPARSGLDFDAVGTVLVENGSVRVIGSLSVQALGPRVGRIPMQPQRTLRNLGGLERLGLPAGEPLDAVRRVWSYEVERHNAPIAERLKAAGRMDACDDAPGRMAAALLWARALLVASPSPAGELLQATE